MVKSSFNVCKLHGRIMFGPNCGGIIARRLLEQRQHSTVEDEGKPILQWIEGNNGRCRLADEYTGKLQGE